MFKISEIKKWAKSLGYDAIKNKDDNQYYWKQSNSDSPNDCGITTSVSKLAKAIFNHHTKYKWIDHQNEYDNNKQINHATVNDYGN
jgi:hypothetical protein